jgi:hypothetical protein
MCKAFCCVSASLQEMPAAGYVSQCMHGGNLITAAIVPQHPATRYPDATRLAAFCLACTSRHVKARQGLLTNSQVTGPWMSRGYTLGCSFERFNCTRFINRSRSFLFLAWPFNKILVKTTEFVLTRTYGVYGGLNWVPRMGIGISVRLYRIKRHHPDAAGRRKRFCCFQLYCMQHHTASQMASILHVDTAHTMEEGFPHRCLPMPNGKWR